jgi:hypothetical protein
MSETPQETPIRWTLFPCQHKHVIDIVSDPIDVRFGLLYLDDPGNVPQAKKPRWLGKKSGISWCRDCGAISFGRYGKWREPRKPPTELVTDSTAYTTGHTVYAEEIR